jgi:type III restriction enzyme
MDIKPKFKRQQFQTNAVEAVVDCFLGQPPQSTSAYRLDPGRQDSSKLGLEDEFGFRNAYFALPLPQILKNINAVQQRQDLPISAELKTSPICDINLDIEMETGTGKTYCYIKTIFELHQRHGWSKFIIVVPSIAIREGVYESFKDTADHFQEEYKKRAHCFIYNSKQLHQLESFSSDASINVMIINVQAFNATGKDNRRIYDELDDFQSRRPIDVIKMNRPILILDEPQKMEGVRTTDSLKEFNPLMILRYSATHTKEHNKIHRLDALDAYNQKLVKKISVRGISVKGLAGTQPYLYLDSIKISANKPPEARLELEISQASGIKRITRIVEKNRNLYDLSGQLESYKGFVVSDINALDNTISFSNGIILEAGEATGDVNESALRRIQIREAIKAHFEKEQVLFSKGIKVLTLFFIDQVSKYRCYDDAGEQAGEYAKIFEEEYAIQHKEQLRSIQDGYYRYLKRIDAAKTHQGYFSIDKKTKRMMDPEAKKRGEGAGEADDVDAYDLILKGKKRLLSFDEPVRFIFSHSALREGWDNPNVFVICALKHPDSNNVTARRQEVGRGLRLCVNQNGERVDDPATVHQINGLTVVASESYKDFVTALQKDISDSLSARPRKADEAYFTGKILKTENGEVAVTPQMAKAIYKYLLKNDYTDSEDRVTTAYHEAKSEDKLAPLPPELQPYTPQIIQLIDTVYSDAQLPGIEDERKVKENPLNANFDKKEFQELWQRINRKAVYSVDFETGELEQKCVAALNTELSVTPLQYTIQRGEQTETASYDMLAQGEAFVLKEIKIESLKAPTQSSIKYDLIGKIAAESQLTRSTVARILQGLKAGVFKQYKANPEDFITKTARIINEQKATVIIEHLAYNPTEDRHTMDIFTQEKLKADFSKAVKANRHIYDYVFTQSQNERNFVSELDTGAEVVVYAKLPRGFKIPTPVGDYNPDWAIAFQQGAVKHVYFVAETKGSMSSMELRKTEACKIDCAKKFFAKIISEQVKYDVVTSYGKLMELVK